MATVSIDVPDEVVDELVAALADFLGVPPPTTAAEKAALARAFMKGEAKKVLLAFRAAKAARATASDGSAAATW